VNFIPDSGKYEIVGYICTCVGGHYYANTPLKRVADEVVGWTVEVDSLEAGKLLNRYLLPLRPVILRLDGLQVVTLTSEHEMKVGSPRLAPIGQAQMSHSELIALHRTLHGRD
jgi:hypothetical protein